MEVFMRALVSLIQLFLITATAFADSAVASMVEKPVLHYFSSPSCPACAMMGPVLKDAKESLADKVEFREYKNRSAERNSLMERFSRQVDMSYVPTWILSDSTGRIFTYGKGFVPSAAFLDDLGSGLEKRSRLNELKVSQLIFVCETGGPACATSEQAVDEFVSGHKGVKVEKVDVSGFKTEEEWKSFFTRVNGFRYMRGMEYIPALIALSDKNEVVELLQKGFSKTEIESRLKGLY